jgi:PAS domain-containing protein
LALAFALWRIALLSRAARETDSPTGGELSAAEVTQEAPTGAPGFDDWLLPGVVFSADGRAVRVNPAFIQWHGGAMADGLPEQSKAIARLRLEASRRMLQDDDAASVVASRGIPVDLTASDGASDSFLAYFSPVDAAGGHRWCVLTPMPVVEEGIGLAEIFEEAPFGAALVDREGKIAAANRPLSGLVGSNGASLIGRNLTDFIRDGDRATFATLIANAVSGEGATASWNSASPPPIPGSSPR